MTNNISEKDKKDWENFIRNNEKIYNKDLLNEKKLNRKLLTKTIDLHGYSLEDANKTIKKYINNCFSKNIKRLVVITG